MKFCQLPAIETLSLVPAEARFGRMHEVLDCYLDPQRISGCQNRREEETMTVLYPMHVGICVRDLELSVRFYRDGLGFEEAGRLETSDEPTATLLGIPGAELQAVYLERDGLRIELLHYPKPGAIGTPEARPMNQVGLTHLAVGVEKLDDAIAKLTALGATALEQTRVHNDEFDAKLIYITDPDGTRIECVETPKDPTRQEPP